MALTWPIGGADVAHQLKWPDSRADECEDDAAAAVEAIEKRVGPWHGQRLTHTTQLSAPRHAIVLPWGEVASIDTVTVDGIAVPFSGNDEAGIVYGDFGSGRIVITATARPADTCPAVVVKAAKVLAAFWVKQTIGPTQVRRAGGEDTDVDVQQGFAFPRRVSELIRDYHHTGGFA